MNGCGGGQTIPASVALAWNPPRGTAHEEARPLVKTDAGVPGGVATLQIIRTSEGLELLGPEWKELYLRSKPRNPFLSHAWTHACWLAQQRPSEPFILTLRDAGKLIAIAPLCIENRLGLRVLRFIGDDRSDYLGFLCAPEVDGLEQSMLDRLLALGGEWDIALLRQLTDSYTGLHQSPLPPGVRSQLTEWIRAPHCKAEGDWESFHKSGPSWLREMRKRSRRFSRDGHKAECFRGQKAIARLGEVSRIEAHSWKGREQSTRLQPGPGRELLERAFEILGSRGEMELWLAFVDEQAVAFQIDFVMDDRVWHYQCAYDERFGHTRAGSILTYQALQSAWERGVREFDYLSGEEPYKLERTNASRSIYHLAAHRRTARGWLAYGLLVAPRWRLRRVRALRAMHKAAGSLKRNLRPRSDG